MLIVTFAGDRINRTLSRIVQARNMGHATSNYQIVNVDVRRRDSKEIEEDLGNLLQQLRGREDTKELIVEIAPLLPRFSFSPFAECLPDNLYVAAMVEEHLDCNGLIELLRKTNALRQNQ